MRNLPATIFKLIFLLIYSFTNNAFRLEMCPPPEGRLWVDFAKDLLLIWTKLASCNSSESCIDSELVLRDIRPQILPILAQLGQRVSIQMPRESFVFQVKETEFLSCQPAVNNHPQRNIKSILLRPEDLDKTESTYLLVRSIDMSNTTYADEDPCSDGMKRLNISWVANTCTDINHAHKFACSRNGWCLATKLHTPFKCWCCEDYWSDNELCTGRGKTIVPNHHSSSAEDVYCDCKQDPNKKCCLRGACQSNPCRNGGICRNRFPDEGGGYECICALGFIGHNCEKTDLATCDLSHCPPMHHCFQNTEGGTECVPDYIKEQLPGCDSSLCFNQAECYIVRQTARCFCSYLFDGAYCKRSANRFVKGSSSKSRVYFGLATFACAFGTLVAVLVICRVHTWKCYVVPKNRRRSEYSTWAENSDALHELRSPSSPTIPSDETSRFSSSSLSTRQNLYTAETEELMLENFKPIVHDNSIINVNTALGAERDMLVTRT